MYEYQSAFFKISTAIFLLYNFCLYFLMPFLEDSEKLKLLDFAAVPIIEIFILYCHRFL